MYEAFFGLSERPFDLTANPKYLFLTDSHREALSNLEYGLVARSGVTLLCGDAGTGNLSIFSDGTDWYVFSSVGTWAVDNA